MKAKLLAFFFFLFHTSHRSNFHIFHSIFFFVFGSLWCISWPLENTVKRLYNEAHGTSKIAYYTGHSFVKIEHRTACNRDSAKESLNLTWIQEILSKRSCEFSWANLVRWNVWRQHRTHVTAPRWNRGVAQDTDSECWMSLLPPLSKLVLGRLFITATFTSFLSRMVLTMSSIASFEHVIMCVCHRILWSPDTPVRLLLCRLALYLRALQLLYAFVLK